jgi:hypothetical protein
MRPAVEVGGAVLLCMFSARPRGMAWPGAASVRPGGSGRWHGGVTVCGGHVVIGLVRVWPTSCCERWPSLPSHATSDTQAVYQ